MIARAVVRLRGLLNLYSPQLSSRITVSAAILLALVLASPAGTAPGAAAFILAVLVWANHERFAATLDQILEHHPAAVIVVPLLVLAVWCIYPAPTASDDLLRHIAQAFRPGGYRDMYVHTSLPPASLYPGFDWLAGSLALALGPERAMWTLQACAWLAFITVFTVAALRAAGSVPRRHVWVLVALVLALTVASPRLFLGRPEIFMTSWVLAAVLPRRNAEVLVWAVTGVLLGTCYFMAPVYYPAAILLGVSLRARAMVFVGLGLAWVALWIAMTGYEFVPAIRWSFEQMLHRLPGVKVQENTPLFTLLHDPWVLVVIGACAWTWRRNPAGSRLLLLAAYFASSLQVRYGSTIVSLLALYALGGVRTLPFVLPSRASAWAVCVGALVIVPMAGDAPRYSALPWFELPDGAVVLTAFDEAPYALPFHNRGNLRVAPAFEVGAATHPAQALVLELHGGKMDCERLRPFGFTHVVEKTLSGAPVACLHLTATRGPWRLWSVLP